MRLTTPILATTGHRYLRRIGNGMASKSVMFMMGLAMGDLEVVVAPSMSKKSNFNVTDPLS